VGIRFAIRDAGDVWVKFESFEGRLWDLPRQRGKTVACRSTGCQCVAVGSEIDVCVPLPGSSVAQE